MPFVVFVMLREQIRLFSRPSVFLLTFLFLCFLNSFFIYIEIDQLSYQERESNRLREEREEEEEEGEGNGWAGYKYVEMFQVRLKLLEILYRWDAKAKNNLHRGSKAIPRGLWDFKYRFY